jgi:hypothetical protein
MPKTPHHGLSQMPVRTCTAICAKRTRADDTLILILFIFLLILILNLLSLFLP